MTARRAAEFRGTLGPERHCAVDFIPRCEAIQPDAVFFYVEVLHYALRTIQTLFRELPPLADSPLDFPSYHFCLTFGFQVRIVR
jgi:hypothetical protein